jgi:hypothetical protein
MDGKSPENLGQEVAQNINYFQVGVCNGKELVVFKKKKNGSSIFTVLQPLYDLSDPKNEVCITYRRFWSTGPSHPWFRVYKASQLRYMLSDKHINRYNRDSM